VNDTPKTVTSSASTTTSATAMEVASAAPSASAKVMSGDATGVPKTAVPAPDDVAAPPKDAIKTASGLASKVIKKGTGKDHPGKTDKVKVLYTGWTTDGKMFDSTKTRGDEPISFTLDHVIKGWTEGVGLMVKGETRRLWIPSELAYGEHPRAGAPMGALTFDIELLDIVVPQKPPAAPSDVKAPPADAKKTASGLAYKLLKKSTIEGAKSPGPTDSVSVNYTGWTTDGKMFDSSFTDGDPVSFRLNQVIKGWTEGVQLMKKGDTMRFWIPADLAYGEKPTRPGAPAGMLCFDIELLDLK
jgi:peptidylprolyl isomerase